MMYVIAGEASGDLIGGPLLASLKLATLKSMQPAMIFKGIGGARMEAQGLKTVAPFKDFAIMGFTDIIKAFPRIYRHFHALAKSILQDNPEAVVMIDYPGFNLRLAKHLRKKGYKGKLIHYVSPTVWAWGKKRIQSMANTLDLLLTIFPFEPALYAHTPLKAVFVGHPLMTILQETPYNPNWREKYGIPKNMPLLALFPGSREGEIKRHLPLLLETAEHFIKTNPTYGVAIASNAALAGPHYLIAEHDRYHLMQDAHVALAKSGTVTLELALKGCPTVVVYLLTKLNYFLARFVFQIKLPFYSLPNILLNKMVASEWYGVKLCPQKLAESLTQQIASPNEKKNLENVLTHKNASEEAAKEIIACMKLKKAH